MKVKMAFANKGAKNKRKEELRIRRERRDEIKNNMNKDHSIDKSGLGLVDGIAVGEWDDGDYSSPRADGEMIGDDNSVICEDLFLTDAELGGINDTYGQIKIKHDLAVVGGDKKRGDISAAWSCPVCGMMNKMGNTVCTECHTPFIYTGQGDSNGNGNTNGNNTGYDGYDDYYGDMGEGLEDEYTDSDDENEQYDQFEQYEEEEY